MSFIQSKKLILTLIIVTIVYSILAFVILPAESFFAGDEGVKFIQMKSLLKYNYKSLSLYYPGKNIDQENKFFPIIPPYAVEREGEMFSQWPILFPFASSLFFNRFGLKGLYIIPVLSSLLTLLVVSKIFRLLFMRDSILILMLLAFATPVFFYSLVFWEHTLSLLLSTLAIYLILVSLERPGYGWMLLAGVLLGLGVWVRNELYFFVLALLISGFATRSMWKSRVIFRETTYFFVGLFLVLIPMWAIQKATVGELLGADISQFIKASISTEASPFKSTISSFLLYKIKLAAVLLFHRFHNEWMIILVLPYFLFALVMIVPKLKNKKFLLLFSLVGMAAVSLFVLFQNLLNSGLIINTPFVIFSLAMFTAYQKFKERGRPIFFVYLTGLVYILLVSLFAPATGGMQWGPRFMLPALPFLLVALGGLWDNWEMLELRGIAERFTKAALVLLVLISLFVQVKGVQYLYSNRKEDARLVAKVEERPENVFITNNYWFPQETAVLFESKKFYFVDKLPALNELVKRMEKGRKQSFAFVSLDDPRDRPSLDISGSRFARTAILKLPSGFWLESYASRQQ